jgi:3-oxoacyl-[acyl-carrier protein] reductase
MSFLEERCGLKEKVAVVAGGGGGLGRATALDLAAAGMSLALCDVDQEALERTAADTEQLGAETITQTLDVRDCESLAGFFELVQRRHRRLDVLVNVVGGTFRSPFVDVSEKGRDTLVRTNFSWVADAIARAAKLMSDGGRGGSIITITSIEAHRAAPGFAVYAAMKAAVTHLSRTLAVELGPAGIRVNCIAPDFVPTPGLAGVASSAGTAGVRASVGGEDDPGDALTIPLGRKGRLEDIGSCALFLASDLSSYITGCTLHPDGGALAASGWMRWPDDGYTARPPSWVLDQLVEDPEHTGR